ncbi:arylesterase monooxygenase [Colletotrichum kahawae]|uniref:Arylesterase monooxygenase n=1 Tax=Colletotrichum kahawae TaxID=34407 RepID=A0AAD9XV26_COLKA|nr:arylesterase monooxygenase [Colletotrichum kahawae]
MTTTAANTALRFDPEYLAVVSARDGGGEGPAPFKDVYELRAWSEPMLRSVLKAQPWPETVLETRIPFKSHDGQNIDLVRFATQEMADASEPQGAVVYFPDGLGAEDVYFGLRHLSEHAREWNVDPVNIVIMGDSAGAGIAAGVALIARDRGLSPGLRKQILVYPMLDDRTDVPETAGHLKFLAWNTNDNRLAWGAVLGAKAGDPAAEVSLYAAPGRARVEDLRGLPPTYIDVGGLDLFRDECIEYAAKLSKADVEVEFHMWPGLPHGFESAPGIRWVERALEARNEAIKRL